MKRFITLFFFVPFYCSGQTTNDYNSVMQKFQQFYNAGKGDSINAMFGHDWDEAKTKTPLWTNKDAAECLEKLGTIQSCTLIGMDDSEPNKVYVFETTFSKAGKKMTSCNLDKDLAFGTFRLVTTPNKVTKLVGKQNKATRSS